MSTLSRPLIIKIDVNPRRRRDRLTNDLGDAGFQVINALTIQSALKLGQRSQPHLIMVVDNLKRDLDAVQWLKAQHTNPNSHMVAIPLLILADNARMQPLKIHELPDRIRVVSKQLSTADLVLEIDKMIHRWHF